MRITVTLLALSQCLLYATAQAETLVTLSFVGDCTLGSEERYRKEDFSLNSYRERLGDAYFFKNARMLFQQDDWTIVNLESVLSDSDANMVRSKTYCFRGPASFVNILKEGDVEAVSLANNHSIDYGRRGIADTKATLAAAGIRYFGGVDEVAFLEKNGVRIAFVGIWERQYWASFRLFQNLLRSLRDEADAVVCSLHFGTEYAQKHTIKQRKMAREVVAAGADLVIGHHPHVLQGLEVYQGRLILYSLGNFVFGGNASVKSRYTMIVQADLYFDDQGNYQSQQLRLYPCYISGDAETNNYQPVFIQDEEEARAALALMAYDSEFPLLELPLEDGCFSLPVVEEKDS